METFAHTPLRNILKEACCIRSLNGNATTTFYDFQNNHGEIVYLLIFDAIKEAFLKETR